MLRRLLKSLLRPLAPPPIAQLYRFCVEQARQPAFYAELHAPDTIEGRFDLLLLHVLLLVFRLKAYPQDTQALFDILYADTDKNLRQMGVSDMTIAKKMKPYLAAFYGRAKVYEPALIADDDTLMQALRRNIYDRPDAATSDLERLTAYVRRTHQALAAATDDDLRAGNFSFPVVLYAATQAFEAF